MFRYGERPLCEADLTPPAAAVGAHMLYFSKPIAA